MCVICPPIQKKLLLFLLKRKNQECLDSPSKPLVRLLIPLPVSLFLNLSPLLSFSDLHSSSLRPPGGIPFRRDQTEAGATPPRLSQGTRFHQSEAKVKFKVKGQERHLGVPSIRRQRLSTTTSSRVLQERAVIKKEIKIKGFTAKTDKETSRGNSLGRR